MAKVSLGGAAGRLGAAAACEKASLSTRPGSTFPSPALGWPRFLEGCIVWPVLQWRQLQCRCRHRRWQQACWAWSTVTFWRLRMRACACSVHARDEPRRLILSMFGCIPHGKACLHASARMPPRVLSMPRCPVRLRGHGTCAMRHETLVLPSSTGRTVCVHERPSWAILAVSWHEFYV